MYQEAFSFQIQENDNLYIYNFTQKEACMHQPYVLSDQLDRWSRISFVIQESLGRLGWGARMSPSVLFEECVHV